MNGSPLREKLAQKETALGLWVTMECPSVSEIAVLLGLDWICIEMEHSHFGFKEVVEHLRVTRGTGVSPIVRVPRLQLDYIRRALDIGAHGVIVPMVGTAEELRQAMSFAKYPPEGVRGIGGDRSLSFGLGMKDYLAQANREIMVIPLIESREGVENIDEILAVPGLEAIFFGPVDMSASYGHVGRWDGPGVPEHIVEIQGKAASRGIVAGIMAPTLADLKTRQAQGFRLLSLGNDTNLLIRAIRESLGAIGESREYVMRF